MNTILSSPSSLSSLSTSPSTIQQEMAGLYPSKEGFKVRLSDSSSSCNVTNSDKWRISLLAGILFLIVSAPLLYKLVNAVLQKISPQLRVCDESGCPTSFGLVLHTIVFVLVTRLSMK